MRWKTTLILLIATIGIGAYVSLYELKQPTPEEWALLAKQVVKLSSDEVTQLRVECPGTRVTLERSAETWRMTAPLAARAEELLVQRVLGELDPLQAERVLEHSTNKPLALSDYGLEPPRGTLTIKAGQHETVLAFGESTAVGKARYLKRADAPQVFVVRDMLFEALQQPVEAYRSHELLSFNAWEARRIMVASPPTSSYTLTKHPAAEDGATPRADRWQITEPLLDGADEAAVSALLSKLRGLRIERFVTDHPKPEELSTWGLDQPPSRIIVVLDPNAAPLELRVGTPTTQNPDQRYAKRTDEPTVYAVAQRNLAELLQDPDTLRSRALLDAAPGQVKKLQVSWQGASWTIEQIEGRWKHAEGRVDLETEAVENFLWKLHDLKLLRFIEEPSQEAGRRGLEPPKGMVQAWLTGQEAPIQLSIGETVGQGPTRYGRVSGRSGVIELPATLDEILSTQPSSLTTPASPTLPAPLGTAK